MKAERLQQIEKIYHAALEISPSKRESFFNEFCGGDEELCREVKSLLSFEKSSDNFFDTPPESFVAEMFSQKNNHTNLIGKAINQYKIISLLGKGGMGEIFLANDTKLDRKVALKILPSEFAENTDRMNRFVREAKTASALNHPNIITIYEIGALKDTHYIATELIEGETLTKHFKTAPLNLKNALDIFIQMASALNAAHRAGIIHRDIKPENVMIRPDGLVKILDFGIAKLSADLALNSKQIPNSKFQIPNLTSEALTEIKSTTPGMIIGTVNYMSPEQARGKTVDARSDIFSFGIVLYEVLTGKKPFEGETAMDTISAILHLEPLSLNQLLPELPSAVEQIINKTLRKNTDERYQTAKDLLTDLRSVKQRLDYEEIERSITPVIPEPEIISENLPPNNLSSALSSLIGREAEVAEIMDLLSQPNTRLLTITGVSGTGKTRISQAIAHESLAEFSEGVYFINLAAIANSALVVPLIGQTLGLREESGKPMKERIGDYLREKKMLIVLDNFEQIAEAAPTIGELLSGAPNLKILVTSRVRLNLRSEREFTLQPLGVPIDKRLTANEFGRFPAVALFVERAKAAKSNFALTDENAGSVAEICRRLDGLPLAIELAAVRVKLFTPTAILNRLEKSLDLLTGGAKDLPKRQQTMRGAIAWSYELLDADEKKLLNRLSVFRGGLNLEGAEAIGNAEADLSVDLLDVVSSLVDKSLLSQREQADGEPRFLMLVVVREFAFEKLTESGEADEIKRRHTAFYTDLSEEAEPDLLGAKAAEWMEKFEQEHDNLRVALEWALENQPETALRIVGIIYRFWLRRGYSAEGRKWIRAALKKSGEKADVILRAKAARGGGLLSLQQGDFEAANSFIEESLRLSREIGDKSLISYALTSLGALRVGEGDLIAAQKLTEECLAIAEEIDDKFQISISLNRLGDMSRQKEDYQAARKYYAEAYAIAKQESISAAIPIFAHNLASAMCLLEDFRSAHLYNLESLKGCEELGHKTGFGGALSIFAALSVKAGEVEKAARLFGAVKSIYDVNGYKLEKADQDFDNYYIKEARTAIGDTAFDAAYAEGRKLSLEDAVALAREGESVWKSAVTKKTQITNEAGANTKNYSTKDSLEAQIAKLPSVEPVIPDVSRPHSFLSQIGRKGVFVTILIIFLLTVSGFFGYRYFSSNTPIKSIAVMPFANETGNANNEYLSDGLTDGLINKLSQLPHIKVIARSSSFKYKGKELNVGEIAKTLGVQAVITGRITQQGNNLQISIEMINAAENTQIWGEMYNRKVSDVLAVQQDIARTVSEKLLIQLSVTQEKQIAKQFTTNSQAYQFYLNGVFFRRKNGVENIRKAIEYQKQAISLDVNFTLAYIELSINLANLIEIGAVSPKEGLPPARAAAEKALALDDALADAYYNIARIRKYEFEWTKAETAFKRAIEINPNLAAAHTIYAEYLSQLGRFDEALREIKMAQELDPLRTGLVGNEGSIYYLARQYDEAVVKKQIHVSSAAENPFAHLGLANAYVAKGRYAKAFLSYQMSIKLEETTSALIYMGRLYALTGRRAEATAILEKLNTTEKYVSPTELAILYAALGDREKAFVSLEKAYTGRDFKLNDLKVEPAYDPLREDPRFQELLKKVGFPQ